jgi:DNA-binding transcriptional regulator YiaG
MNKTLVQNVYADDAQVIFDVLGPDAFTQVISPRWNAGEVMRAIGEKAGWLVDYYSDSTSLSSNEVLRSIVALGAAGASSANSDSSEDIVERIHEASGLTWDQIARCLGVSKRSILSWARGSQVSARNFENLVSLHDMVMELSTGTASGTRVRLMQSELNRPSPLTTWVESRITNSEAPNRPSLRAAELMG